MYYTTQDRDGLANNALLQREPAKSLRSVLTTGSPEPSGGYSPPAPIVLKEAYPGKESKQVSFRCLHGFARYIYQPSISTSASQFTGALSGIIIPIDERACAPTSGPYNSRIRSE